MAPDPKRLPLEGVGGERDPPSTVRRLDALPVDGETGEVQRRHGAGDLPVVVVLPVQRPDPRAEAGRHALLPHPGQDGMGTDLYEGVEAHRHERGHAVGEPHRRQHVLHPVLRIGELTPDGGAGDVGDHAHPGPVEREGRQGPTEVGEHGLHQRGVKCVRDAQRLHPNTLRSARLGEGGHIGRRSGNHSVHWPVDRGHRHHAAGGYRGGH